MMRSWVANAMAHDTVPHTVGPENRAMIQELTECRYDRKEREGEDSRRSFARLKTL
jgi:hypothetical protein